MAQERIDLLLSVHEGIYINPRAAEVAYRIDMAAKPHVTISPSLHKSNERDNPIWIPCMFISRRKLHDFVGAKVYKKGASMSSIYEQ